MAWRTFKLPLIPPLLIDLLAVWAVGQQTAPTLKRSADAQLVRVHASWSAGMCHGYCVADLVIDKRHARLTERAFSEKDKYPKLKAHRKLTKREWDELAQTIDLEAQAAMTGRIGCPGCVDEVVESIEVQFKDGTKKSAYYNAGNEPATLARIVRNIDSIRSKVQSDIPKSTDE